MILTPIWHQFGMILGSFWNDFGVWELLISGEKSSYKSGCPATPISIGICFRACEVFNSWPQGGQKMHQGPRHSSRIGKFAATVNTAAVKMSLAFDRIFVDRTGYIEAAEVLDGIR